jgi:putative DNA primase/helicase
MVALVEHVDYDVVGVHRTFLTRNQSGAWHRRDRKWLGPLGGGAVRLAKANAHERLVVSEGIETTLSVMITTGLPGWAALSASGIVSLALPREVQRVLIFADHDANGAGERAAWEARKRWSAEGRAVLIARPQQPGDANDLLLSGGRHAGERER